MHDALILRTAPYSESTLIVTVLTREAGVIRALAKGARRIQGRSARSAAAFDLFTRIRANIRMPAREDGLGNITSAEIRGGADAGDDPALRRDWLHNDLRRLAWASLGMEVLGAVASASRAEPWFFDEAEDYLDALGAARAPGSLTAALLLRLLHHAGNPPEIDDALADADMTQAVVFNFATGCFLPAASSAAHGSGCLPFAADLFALLRPVIESPPPLGDGFSIPSRHGAEMTRWLIRVWEDHLNQTLRSKKFLEEVTLGRGETL